MDGFDQFLTRYAILLMVFVCTFTALIVCRNASRFRGRILPTLALAASTVPIAIIIGTAATLILAAGYNFGNVLSSFSERPLSTLAFFAETGTEFSIGIPLSVLILIVFQVRRKHPASGS